MKCYSSPLFSLIRLGSPPTPENQSESDRGHLPFTLLTSLSGSCAIAASSAGRSGTA